MVNIRNRLCLGIDKNVILLYNKKSKSKAQFAKGEKKKNADGKQKGNTIFFRAFLG